MTHMPSVADYMARDLITLNPETEINKAAALLLDKKVSGAPVLDQMGQLVGILTKKDCLRAAVEASYYREWGKSVDTFMSRDVQTLTAGMDILEATRRFLDSPFRRFPVLENDRLVGQISRTDVLRAVIEIWN